MSSTRTVVFTVLLALGAVASARAQVPADEPVPVVRNVGFVRAQVEGAHGTLGLVGGADPDTVFVGLSHSDHWSATDNWWNLWAGHHRPGVNDAANAIWDWDHAGVLASHGIQDSLAGWWPDLRLYTSTGGYTRTDEQRPWWALDMGNAANYVINQGPGAKRTYGVVGVWHSDAGVNQPGGSAVQWTPLSGARSAWCGLRQLGDVSVVDPVTGNPFNQSTLERVSGGGAFGGSRRYPGYANQWDQMLYRDIAPPAGQPLVISFLYRTRLSTGYGKEAATRTGWFHGDPLSVTTGNFVSSSAAGENAPRDSFMVYVGVPVDDTSCTYSDGIVGPVYDPQRRWFSEVLRVFGGAPYREVFAVAGCVPADTADATPTATLVLPVRLVDAIRNEPGNPDHLLRLVFRVKTNRGFSDDDGLGGFDSATRGAVLLDDVTVNGVNLGDFESDDPDAPNSIDNRIGASALDHWKSTGKPPSVFAHLGNLVEGITYAELCGAWDSPARFCDIRGNVLMMGNYDFFETMMGPYSMDGHEIESLREGFPGAWSPTINTTVARDGSNAPNPIGLTQSVVEGAHGIELVFDVYHGQSLLPFTGVAVWPAWQVYPVAQANNGAKVWSDPMGTPYVAFDPDPQCVSDFYDLEQDIGWPALANAHGRPDSIRVWIGVYQACFRFGVTLGCNSNNGIYFDNVSLGFVGGSPLVSGTIRPGPVRIDPWQVPADVFPANETPLLPLAQFDTTAALVVGPRNVAPATGDQLRFCVQPDTVVIAAHDVTGSADPLLGNATRLDMVFRILPGPGNYSTSSQRQFPPTASMSLLDAPSVPGNTVAPGDGSFWGEYIADPGPFAGGTHHAHTYWDYLTWNSARCDTAESNVFPFAGRLGSGLQPGLYANMLHEADPKFATLGISKFRCFLVDTAGPAQAGNIACDGSVPAWLVATPPERSGWDGGTTTKEFTKIIPDGLLTPGSHVQYFYRKSACADSLHAYTIVPDTLRVAQPAEGSLDAHRWQQFGVLPDRWKDPAFGGAGMACILYLDWDDRRGNERVWVSVADSLCGTAPASWGVHNGWHAPAIPGSRMADLAAFPVFGKNQQPGTLWDLYGIRAAESGAEGAVSVGARLATRASMGYLTGRYARTAPTPEMLRRFYRMLVIQTGDLNSGLAGPFRDKSQDDIAMLNDFLTGSSANSTAQPRGLRIGGDGFVQGEDLLNGQNASHGLFVSTKLGLTLRNGSYQAVSNNTNRCADLLTTQVVTPNGDIYGVANDCDHSNDLFQRNPAVTEAVDAMYYGNVGVGGPYVASVYKPANAGAGRNWVAYTEGWNPSQMWSRYCATSYGRLSYQWMSQNRLFASQCQSFWHCQGYIDVPAGGGPGPFTDFLKIGNSVVRSGNAHVRFGSAAGGRVRVRLYDVAGRCVRTLADRTFAAGEYDIPWDGADDDGRRAARGVYFVRIDGEQGGTVGSGRIVLLR